MTMADKDMTTLKPATPSRSQANKLKSDYLTFRCLRVVSMMSLHRPNRAKG